MSQEFQHEDDCPCFGDTPEHSIDCKNCTCDKSCKVPPEGWICSREFGHEGPCAARPRKLWEPSMTPIPPMLALIQWIQEHGTAATAERIAKLTEEVEHAKGYAGRMFLAIHPQCTLLPDLMGVLTQIDNALTAIPNLEAENTRLKAPVSDEEREHYFLSYDDREVSDVLSVSQMIASRATRTPQADK